MRDNDPSDTCTMPEWVAIVRSDRYRATIEKIRSEPNKKRRDFLKKKLLPAVTFSASMDTRHKDVAPKDRNYQHSGILQIDVDLDDNPGVPMDEIRAKLMAHPSIFMVATSPSGGIKAACAIPAEIGTHKRAFLAAKAELAAAGVVMDGGTHDIPRLCFLTHDPDAWLREGPAQVLAIPEDEPEDETHSAAAGLVLSEKSQRDYTLEDLREIIASIPRPPYDQWLAICSGAWNHFGESATPVLAARWPEEAPGEYAEKFQHRTTEHTLGTVIHRAKENGWTPRYAGHRATINRIREAVAPADFPDLTRFGESDADNALRVHAVAGGNFHHVAESGQWLIWDGYRWAPDKDGAMVRLFLNVMDGTARQGLEAGKGGESLVKFSMRCRDRAKVMAGIEMLKSVQSVTVSANDLDADPWLLGTPSGLIDLRTGQPVAPDKRALVTKSIACDFDPVADCPTWKKVIHTAAAGDAELIQFLQAWTGYTLTGSVKEECLAFFHGTGANSKGTVTECLRTLMGDYSITAPESLFVADRNSSATNDIARLSGCRMACAAELDENASFAESRLKAITGRDAITARFLHREFFDFQPTHKFWISGNHKPSVRGVDHGIWRRIRLIPFTVTIPKEERDLELADKLRAELPGILNWAIDGCLLWQRDGLQTPRCVAKATAEYQAAEDVVGQFLEDCTDTDDDDRTLRSSLFQAYQAWAEKQGIRKALSATMLNRKLEERGMPHRKIGGAFFWLGIALKTEVGQETCPN